LKTSKQPIHPSRVSTWALKKDKARQGLVVSSRNLKHLPCILRKHGCHHLNVS
jgi:hypothetical protein